MNRNKTEELLGDVFFGGEIKRQTALAQLNTGLETAWQVLTADIPWLHVGNSHTLAKLLASEIATPRYTFDACGSPQARLLSRHAALLSNGLRGCLFTIGRQAQVLVERATPGQSEYGEDIVADRLDLALDVTTPRPPSIFTAAAPVLMLTTPPCFHLGEQQGYNQDWYLSIRIFGIAPAPSYPVRPPTVGPEVMLLPPAAVPVRVVVDR